MPFPRRGVRRDRRLDGGKVRLDEAGVPQALLQRRLFSQASRGVPTVSITPAVVTTGEVVEKYSGPEPRSKGVLAGGLDQVSRVHHDAADVRLAVQRAGMPEEIRQGHETFGGERRKRGMHGSSQRALASPFTTSQLNRTKRWNSLSSNRS